MMTSTTDRIEKSAVLRAPLSRVWAAISDARQFGAWFGVALDGPFETGTRLHGRIVGTTVDAEVAKMQEPHTGVPFDVLVERVEPMRLLSFRWHPSSGPDVDVAAEATTLVEFELEEVPGGTSVRITESGFDAIPLERRANAFAANEQGWTIQLTLIAKYLVLDTNA